MSPHTRTNPDDKWASRQQWIVWLALSVAAGLVILVYVSLSLSTSADPLLLPLDDTYIHFQYAQQMAQGHPMVYRDGDPATSGGTSLLYPPLLALGHQLGFTGWSLAYWALALGALFFFGSAWLIYLLARSNPFQPDRPGLSFHALLLALAFMLSGPFIWSALSGMETALFVFTVLLTLYALQRGGLRSTMLACTLMVLTRPEGLILAGIVVVALIRHAFQVKAIGKWSFWAGLETRPYLPRIFRRGGPMTRPRETGEKGQGRRIVWLALPLLAGAIQPIINLMATGSVSSSGMIAKSQLTNTSVPMRERVINSLEFLWRMWRELITGSTPDFGRMTPFLLAAFAAMTLGVFVVMLWRRQRFDLPIIILLWMLALTAGVATLDTAFWQFRRYQLPIMALFFPVAAWGIAPLGNWLVMRFKWRGLRWMLPTLFVISSALTAVSFADNYAGNVRVVRDQQLPMARWIKTHLPEDARIGVHDVGLMAYFADHRLYDVVGLTTPGPAQAWRQGPGAIYEHMADSDYRPDYFAIYPDVQGLTYLRDADIFGDMLAEFPVDLPRHNVASATDYQAVYAADWSNTRDDEQIAQITTLAYAAGMELVDQVDVANLDSEAAHDYHWWQDQTPPGFVTEVYKNVYRACGLIDEADCWATDGGRVLTGGEEFTLKTIPGQDLLLITRVHGRSSVPLVIFADDKRQADRVQPSVPGRWLEVVTLIQGDDIQHSTTRIRIEAQAANGLYMPFYHWAYQGDFAPDTIPPIEPIAFWGEERAVRLLSYEIASTPTQIDVTLTWAGSATGDGIVFIHLYNQDNIHTEPTAQVVERPGGGALPPGNWLPGVTIRDTYTVPLPDDLPSGTYVVAVGIFDAVTGERYPVSGAETIDDHRLFVGEIIVEE